MAEHGLSIWIESGDHRILFDTGQGAALPHNSEILGIPLEEAEGLVLSHGHYDHTGGISYAIGSNPGIDVYCHPGVVVQRYSIRPNAQPRKIQMQNESKSLLDNMAADKLHMVTKPSLIAPDIGLTGPIPRICGFEDTGGLFFLDIEGRQADPIDDDQAMWIRSERGLVVVMGCCHSGTINTIEYIRKIAEQPRVVAVIGGFHLGETTGYRLEKTCGLLRELDLELLVPCHCTGEAASERFRNVLGDVVKPGYAGFKTRI